MATMSTFLQRQRDDSDSNISTNRLIVLLVILACLFSQCSVHAQNQNNRAIDVGHSQSHHDMSHDIGHQPDCCDDQTQCCEGPDVINSTLLLDHSIVMMLTQFIGLNTLMTSGSAVVVDRIALIPPATGPPIRIAHCCYIL